MPPHPPSCFRPDYGTTALSFSCFPPFPTRAQTKKPPACLPPSAPERPCSKSAASGHLPRAGSSPRPFAHRQARLQQQQQCRPPGASAHPPAARPGDSSSRQQQRRPSPSRGSSPRHRPCSWLSLGKGATSHAFGRSPEPLPSGAHNLFYGMAHRNRARKAPGPGGEDRISALPDGVLQHVLGFLPADEAVRTCVLAPRWRHLWRSLGRLRIVSSESEEWKSFEQFDEFVNRLLLHRDPSLALDEVEFSGGRFLCSDNAHINGWIRHALLCRASVLSASLDTANIFPVHRLDGTLEMLHIDIDRPVVLDGPALHSQHLAKLELGDVRLESNFLDFSACPALEDLTITKSQIFTHNISSQSVKRLTISQCHMDGGTTRIHISVPNLVWLHLHCGGIHAPILERMPSLDTAFVKLPYFIAEECTNGYWGECCGTCNSCLGNDDHDDYRGRSLLLGSLSSVKNLELIAERGMPIFYRDLQWCRSPAFRKLKTLLLNEWCVAIGLHALACILEHSPVLEKLTLQLAKGLGTLVELEGIYIPTEQLPAVSEHLTVVEIKCEEVDGRVCMILMFLSRFGRQIKITPDSRPSTSFSFE